MLNLEPIQNNNYSTKIISTFVGFKRKFFLPYVKDLPEIQIQICGP